MPVSRSKRRKKGRPRRPPSVQTPPKRRRTARWVPPAFFGLMGLGIAIIVLNYMQLPIWPFEGTTKNYLLFVGLGMMGAAFLVSTRWY